VLHSPATTAVPLPLVTVMLQVAGQDTYSAAAAAGAEAGTTVLLCHPKYYTLNYHNEPHLVSFTTAGVHLRHDRPDKYHVRDKPIGFKQLQFAATCCLVS
jgi:hypothetical protein